MKTVNHMEMCIEKIKNTKENGADLESILHFLAGWFWAESELAIDYSSTDVLNMIKAILGEGE